MKRATNNVYSAKWAGPCGRGLSPSPAPGPWRSGGGSWHPAAIAAQQIDNDARAQQLARAIASDIQLYNKQKIEEALKNDNFFDALQEEISEGRDLFRGRVTPELFRKNYYDRAIVDRVIKPMASLKTPIW